MTANFFDVIVIGGGHAGAEAAWAASRLLGDRGRVAMVTMDPLAIGRMSCNPAIGGLAKGQMVREIDALGGLMAHAIDATGIQFRVLNKSKGPAVQSPRAQADKYEYAKAVQKLLRENCGNLTVVPGIVDQLLTEETHTPGATTKALRDRAANIQEYGHEAVTVAPDLIGAPHRITGVLLESGKSLQCRCVVATTGTFLRGLMHTGEAKSEGGRVGEQSARGFSASLKKLGFELGRLKTGTPPRVARESCDLDALEQQHGDNPPAPFGFLSGTANSPAVARFPMLPQVPCYITYTNEHVHQLIRSNLHRAPMYSGQILSRGPRYCPSIEDKVVRFADKPQHQIFLEPESLGGNEIYCNGISTSLPADVQEAMVHGIRGLERAKILRWGYAVEYDFSPTHQVNAALETRLVDGLYFAGQINGTSGYEEAAAQGLIAGINAARKIRGDGEFILRRDQAYIGVMIDDLITKTPTEPYRMFTSRAEFRLILRSDNADQRLTPLGYEIGLAEECRMENLRKKLSAMQRAAAALKASRTASGISAYEMLRRPEVQWADLAGMAPALAAIFADPEITGVMEDVTIETKYAGYIERERHAAERMGELESKSIPAHFDFGGVPELRKEAKQALAKFRPQTIGQASRLEGITPSDLTILMIYIGGKRKMAAV